MNNTKINKQPTKMVWLVEGIDSVTAPEMVYIVAFPTIKDARNALAKADADFDFYTDKKHSVLTFNYDRETIKVYVPEDGQFHRKKIVEGAKYELVITNDKYNRSIKPEKGYAYRLDMIDANNIPPTGKIVAVYDFFTGNQEYPIGMD